MTMQHPDGPWDEVIAKATEQIKAGAVVFQKFTCAGCGARLSIEEPNVFHETGTCDQCPAITDIKSQGCGFWLLKPLTEEGRGDIARILGRSD